MLFSVGQANRLGNRASNQDRCLMLERNDTVILAVADGMGGHARGDLAAQAFVDSLSRQFCSRDELDDAAKFLRGAFPEAHRTIQRVGQAQNPPLQPLTTGVACIVQDGVAQWAHIGDSRAYLIRDGHVELRTRDHTRVADMIEAGLITEQQARIHPLRNHVSMCLGGTPQPQPVTLGPTIYLVPGDTLLLCSDGLWSAISETRLLESLAQDELAEAIDALAEIAERASYPQSDNVSAVALRWEGPQACPLATDEDRPHPSRTFEGDPVERAIAEINQALDEYGSEMDLD